jgi:ornithine cyclodeaminase/alanine dehydrogenase-like protein (mu-crystallin family)
VLYLGRADVIRSASDVDAVRVIRDALILHAAGRTTLPDEAYLPWTTSTGAAARSLCLPGALWDDSAAALGVKIINSSLDNPSRGIPRAQGLIVLFDPETAYPTAILEAAYISALRTSAYTALSVRLLAIDVAQVAILGCGALGGMHTRLLAAEGARVFRLFDAETSRAEALAARLQADGHDATAVPDARTAVREAHVVVTTTTTTEGYLAYDWLRPGALIAHVSLDDVLPEVVERSALVVVDDWGLVSTDERRLLGRMYRAGALLGPGGEAAVPSTPTARAVDATLADIVSGRHPGRTGSSDVVLSNPFGMGILDVALATAVRAAATSGVGVEIDP